MRSDLRGMRNMLAVDLFQIVAWYNCYSAIIFALAISFSDNEGRICSYSEMVKLSGFYNSGILFMGLKIIKVLSPWLGAIS